MKVRKPITALQQITNKRLMKTTTVSVTLLCHLN